MICDISLFQYKQWKVYKEINNCIVFINITFRLLKIHIYKVK